MTSCTNNMAEGFKSVKAMTMNRCNGVRAMKMVIIPLLHSLALQSEYILTIKSALLFDRNGKLVVTREVCWHRDYSCPYNRQ